MAEGYLERHRVDDNRVRHVLWPPNAIEKEVTTMDKQKPKSDPKAKPAEKPKEGEPVEDLEPSRKKAEQVKGGRYKLPESDPPREP